MKDLQEKFKNMTLAPNIEDNEKKKIESPAKRRLSKIDSKGELESVENLNSNGSENPLPKFKLQINSKDYKPEE